ncbi:MAG: DUF4105 domain-containing protein [Pseudomonadota bacterium]
MVVIDFLHRFRRGFSVLLTVIVILLTLFFGFAMHYWLGWPDWIRTYGSVGFVGAALLLWFMPWNGRRFGRSALGVALAGLAVAYSLKTPVEQEWVPLHERRVAANFDGSLVRVSNFRDAVHTTGEPAVPRWGERVLDLDRLESAELILQPFGRSKATEHVMLSFRFDDGQHVAVSMEARRTSWESFDVLAGFFRHDQIYPVIGTERDLLWKRLARDPPFQMYFYPLEATPEALREYLRRILAFADSLNANPQFYSTITDSCMTALIKLAPEVFDQVPWTDYRRWVPGYSLGLLQEIGLVSQAVAAEALAEQSRLRPGIRDPREFADDAAWSAYLRQ